MCENDAGAVGPDALPFGRDWIGAYFGEVDRMDPDGLLDWYEDGASFVFANQASAVGEAAIREVLSSFYGTIRSMRHEPTGVWTDEAGGVLEA